MKIVWLSIVALTSLLLSNGAAAETSLPTLYLSTPGETLQIDIPEHAPSPPMRMKYAWYSVSIDGQDLSLERTVTTRRSDWNEVITQTGGEAITSSLSPKTTTTTRHAIDMAKTALFAFRLDVTDPSEKLLPFKSGKYPSSLTMPALLHDRWSSSFQSIGEAWTVYTESERRKDGGLLAGSLSLVAKNESGKKRLLVPPAHGMAFERQELLWLGSLRPNYGFDLLLKRTWVTGEIEYVLKIGESLGYAKVDPDYPIAFFSQGVEGYESVATHISQKRLAPDGKFGVAAFSIDSETWNKALDTAKADGLPKLLFERQLMLNTEKIRVTFEYLQRLEATESSPSSSQFFWEGPVLVKIHFRGKSQTLLQTANLDDGFRLQVDTLQGDPAIQIQESPHYNNSFVKYWVWDTTKGRFLRLYAAHSQGC